MGMSMMKTLSILYLFALLLGVNGARISIQNAHTSAATPAKETCDTLVSDVLPCLSFFTIGSKEKEPAPTCCPQLEHVLSVNASCLCIGLEAAPSFGFKINYTRAMELPGACGVTKLPPEGQCNFPNAPLPSPSAPVPSPANPPPSSSPPAPAPITPTPATPAPITPTPATPAPSTPTPATPPSTPIVPTMPPSSNSSATAPSSSDTSNSSRRISNVPFLLMLVSAIMVLVSF